MNSFGLGGSPVCPRCSHFVYAAEQVMGPGRKLYHKSCLACTTCNKRLDSFALLEHDEQPYCKPCHLKNFGTLNLRHANLPYALRPPSSSAEDIQKTSPISSPLRNAPSPAPLRPSRTGSKIGNGTNNGPLPRLRPTRSLATSPTSPTFSRLNVGTGSGSNSANASTPVPNYIAEELEIDEDVNMIASPKEEDSRASTPTTSSYPSNTGRPGIGTIPRTIPLGLDYASRKHQISQSLGSITLNSPSSASAASHLEQEGMNPLRQTPTGTRYGVALGGGGGVGVHMTGTGDGSPRKWGGNTPMCPRCSKSVYFAEQVKAVGKTFHKSCLRCAECGSSLDSNRLRDHDEEPFCVRCYNKLYGPQGAGYALLGKAGG